MFVILKHKWLKLFQKIIKTFIRESYLPDFYTTDIHSHLLPKLDDGVKSLEESIQIISKMKELGFKKLITTPHIMNHRFKNSKNNIKYTFEKVKEELKKRKIDIELSFAAEYYYDEHFLEKIRKKDLLTIGSYHVLFEFSYTTPPMMLENTIFELLCSGYEPILAHPERYSYFHNNKQRYHELKKIGILFQLNINSLNGFYGKKVKEAAIYLVENGLIDFVASDTHGMDYIKALKTSLNNPFFKSITKKNEIKNNLFN